MKIKLKQKGFESYTGQMGVVFFKDGVSINDVSKMDAMRMGSVMSIEVVDSDETMNAGEVVRQNMHTTADEIKSIEAPVEVPREQVKPVEGVKFTSDKLYSQELLEKVADEKGIAGLREIAKKFGIRGNSVPAIISAVLKAQGE